MTNGNTMAEMMEQMDNKSFRTPRKGEILRGKVVQITDSEVVVNIGCKSDGIIPKSELSNIADVNPKELLSEDQELDVLVLKSDDGEGNVLLSLKRISPTLSRLRIAEAARTPAASAASSRLESATDPKSEDALTSIINRIVSSRSSVKSLTCGSPVRAVTFQSIVRTSSPGT